MCIYCPSTYMWCVRWHCADAYSPQLATAKSIVRILYQFIAIFGLPKNIQSEQDFTSKFADILHQCVSCSKSKTKALKHFHQMLKSLLRACCVELCKDWEEGLRWLILAARKIIQKHTGFLDSKKKKSPSNLYIYVDVWSYTLGKCRSGKMWKYVMAVENETFVRPSCWESFFK